MASEIKARMYRLYGPREARDILQDLGGSVVERDGLRLAILAQGGVDTREAWYLYASTTDEETVQAIDEAASRLGAPVDPNTLATVVNGDPPPFATIRNRIGLALMLQTLAQYPDTPQGPLRES